MPRNWYAKASRSNAHGGIKHRGIDFASQTLSSYIRTCKMHGQSYGALFVDLMFAFDDLCREIVLNPQDGVVDTIFGKGRVSSLLRNRFEQAWVSTQGVEPVVCTGSGSRPGDPWADMLFGLLNTTALQRIEARIIDSKLSGSVFLSKDASLFACPSKCTNLSKEEVPIDEVSFVDDVVFMIFDSNPAEVIRKMEELTYIVATVPPLHF